MSKYIKYKRIHEFVDRKRLEQIFDELIIDGWDIISYWDSDNMTEQFFVKIVAGKPRQNL